MLAIEKRELQAKENKTTAINLQIDLKETRKKREKECGNKYAYNKYIESERMERSIKVKRENRLKLQIRGGKEIGKR